MSINEMFIKINGKQIFIIMVTCFKKNKGPMVKITISRDENQLCDLLPDVETNNGKPFEMLGIDVWRDH